MIVKEYTEINMETGENVILNKTFELCKQARENPTPDAQAACEASTQSAREIKLRREAENRCVLSPGECTRGAHLFRENSGQVPH